MTKKKTKAFPTVVEIRAHIEEAWSYDTTPLDLPGECAPLDGTGITLTELDYAVSVVLGYVLDFNRSLEEAYEVVIEERIFMSFARWYGKHPSEVALAAAVAEAARDQGTRLADGAVRITTDRPVRREVRSRR